MWIVVSSRYCERCKQRFPLAIMFHINGETFGTRKYVAENGYILFVQTAARKYRMCLSVLRVRNRRRSNMGI